VILNIAYGNSLLISPMLMGDYFGNIIFLLVFIACQHTDSWYWYSKSVHLSVHPSVCPLRSDIRWKWL